MPEPGIGEDGPVVGPAGGDEVSSHAVVEERDVDRSEDRVDEEGEQEQKAGQHEQQPDELRPRRKWQPHVSPAVRSGSARAGLSPIGDGREASIARPVGLSSTSRC